MVGGVITVTVNPVVPDLGGARVDRGVCIVAVGARVGFCVGAVAICVVVTVLVAVAIYAVVPGLRYGWADRSIRVVTVATTMRV